MARTKSLETEKKPRAKRPAAAPVAETVKESAPTAAPVAGLEVVAGGRETPRDGGAVSEAQGQTAELRAELEAKIAELAALKARFEHETDSYRGQIILLNASLRALQAYAGASVQIVAGSPLIASSSVRDLMWFAKMTLRHGPMRAVRKMREYRFLQTSGKFDARFYADQVQGHAFGPDALLRHYIGQGFAEGRDPAPTFSTSKYLSFYSDVKASGSDPFTHFLRAGGAEGRMIAPSAFGKGIETPDCIVRVYARKAANPVVVQRLPVDDRDRHWWTVADRPGVDEAKMGLYDHRPEDDIPRQGVIGEAFMTQFGLLSDAPDYAGAVAHLNEMTAESQIVADDRTPVDVSIVIPIYGQLNYTLNALHSLLQHKTRYSFEIIVGDDRSPDSSGEWLPKLTFIRYLLHEENGGFVLNCNRSSEIARGKTIVMLNNDVRVAPGWLDRMVDSFRQFPKAGLVGSKLFYPDGSLQEAGGIVWQDGSAWNYGRNDDPNRPRYCYARQMDYVSGCSIAVPMDLWREMKGFDPHFAPAYCEDVDLCFRIRQAGYETWFQPLSRIIHYEGKTSGTDTGQGVKAYQVTNMVKLYERWKDVLADHRPNAQEPWLERERKVKKRVLIIDACNPTPKQDAGSVSIINLFRYYQALDYQVSFVPADNFLFQREEVRDMQFMGVQSFYAPYEMSIPKIMEKYAGLYDFVHIIRASVAQKCLDAIKQFTPASGIIYQNSDLHFLRMQRQAAVENKPELLEAAEAMKEKELFITRAFDVTVVHSDVEKQILNTELPDSHVVVMPLIEEIVEKKTDFSARKDFMFLGGYGHPPNVDAALWLVKDIWPALSKALPDARLLLVGAKPPKTVQDLANDRVIVTGMVDDLTPWFARSRLFLAALRYGAGSKGKVLASLAHGVPVVGTDIAAEGLPLTDGVDVAMANTTEEIIAAALKLYKADEKTWQTVSDNGKAYIQAHHSFETGVSLLRDVIRLSGKA